MKKYYIFCHTRHNSYQLSTTIIQAILYLAKMHIIQFKVLQKNNNNEGLTISALAPVVININ